MFYIPTPTWSKKSGDHPAGDGLTRLQCLFAGASAADVSGYGETPTIVRNPGPTDYVRLFEGYAQILMGNGTNYISWASNELGRRPNTGHTIEGFFKAAENHVDPSSMMTAAKIDFLNMAISQMNINGFSGGMNILNLLATAWYNWPDTVDAFSNRLAAYTHIAWVCDATANGDLRVYVNGDRKVLYNTGSLQKTAPYAGSVMIGTDSAGVTQNSWIYCSGIRVRRAEMYTGATFTPPASPAVWGPP